MTGRSALAECRHCHQWENAPDDTYCSGCGRLLLLLEIEPESLVLISTIAPTRELTLRNDGAKPMQVTIVPRNGVSSPAIGFDPASTVRIPANDRVTVRIGVDAARLSAGYQRVLEYACIVDDDPRKSRPFTLDVRSGPSPRLSQTALDFEDVEEGKAVERTVELTNQGSVPLAIRSVRTQGSPHLRLASDYANQVVRFGEKLAIRTTWQSRDGAAPDDETTGLRIEFVNQPDVLFVPARARVFRYRIEAKPDAVAIRQALAKRDYAQQIRLENQGTTDVEILSIESSERWLHVVARATRFTLLCAESAAQRIVTPTTFARFFDFKLICRPKELPAGKHAATVTIRPHGQEPLLLPVEITVVEPKPYHDYIGIDFGTTNSVVAVLSQRDGGVELVSDDASGKELIPSVLVFDDPESYKIGDAARNEADTAPDRTVRSIKRVMGYERERQFFDRSYSAAELASLIIRKLVHLAERKLHADSTNGFHYVIRKAIITVPANFHDLQIRDVLAACDQAGLDIEETRAQKASELQSRAFGAAVNAGIILDEPSAAVLYYIDFLRRTRNSADITKAIAREQGLKLLVFDYGGGTLDVAVASATHLNGGGTGLRILANMGDNTIGGDHIDVVVMQELLRRCRAEVANFDFDTTLIAGPFREFQRRAETEAWSREVWQDLLRVRSQWKDLAEQAKIRAGERKPIEILPDLIVRLNKGRVERPPLSVNVELSTERMNDLLQPVLARCEELILASLALAGVGTDDIDYILHTGRQSLLPQIRDRVRTVFPKLGNDRDLLEEKHLKICVAKGAALYGSMRDRLVAPDARIVLLSDGRRLPHSYGVETFTNPIYPEFDEVIERGAQYPLERTKPYPPEMIPPTGYLNLKFYMNTGTSNAIVANPQVSLVGQISIDTAGREGCEVTFAVGANRTLSVFANGEPVTIEPARLHEEESWIG